MNPASAPSPAIGDPQRLRQFGRVRMSRERGWDVAERRVDISQLRSGWWWRSKCFRAGWHGGMAEVSGVPSGRNELWDALPDTPCLANFPLSRRDEALRQFGRVRMRREREEG